MQDVDRVRAETTAAKSVWETHEDEQHRADNSHYRGVGRWTDDEKWQKIGRETRQSFEALLRLYDYKGDFWATPRAALEWGPGGGANAFAFKDIVSQYYGIEISDKNIAECARMLTAEGSNVLRPVLIQEGLDEVVEKVTDPIDVFLSTAVFQHFPSKAYGKDVIRLMYDKMAPFSVGLVQIRYDNGKERFKPIENLEEYKERHITATSYALDEFESFLRQVGFDGVILSDIRPRSNYATFRFRKGSPNA